VSTLKTALLGLGVWMASAWLTFGAIVAIGSLERSSGAYKQRVAFSEFLADVEAGRVEDVRVEGRVATFRLRRDQRTIVLQTVGPFDDRDQVRALRPDDPGAPAPKVTFER